MLHNKKVLVIGGSSGIGMSIAKSCYEAGASVTIASRTAEKLTTASSVVGERCRYFICDALIPESLDSLFLEVGEMDHVVVSAGKPLSKKFDDLTESEARDDLELNFWLKYRIAKKAFDILSSDGSILFISGAFSSKPNVNLFMTSISVAAIDSLVKNLVLAIGPIRVNAIAPYVIDSSDVTNQPVDENRKEFLNTTRKNLPGNYVGKGKDIGDASVFLLSNKYCNGSILPLDGGYTIA